MRLTNNSTSKMNNSARSIVALTIFAVSAFNTSLFAQTTQTIKPSNSQTSQTPQTPQRTLHGRVIDAATNQPAAGVRVQAYNNASYSAMTDDAGEYAIKVPAFVSSLIFEGEGYNYVQQAVGKDTIMIDTKIYSSKFNQDYAKQTSAINRKTTLATYNNNDISIDNQIQRNLGGDILAVNRSGAVSQGVMMLMNGVNSLNSNAQPLIIIDGVIQNMQYDTKSLHDGFFNNLLSNIMVEDIEKVSVLKNGQAIYGAKGANGVIVIETKRNKSMATKIDVSVGGSYELLPKLPTMMNSDQFRVYASELIGTTGTKSNSFKFLQTDPDYYYYHMYHNQTDWSKEVYKEAFTQNYSINVQGGDDIANYNLSVGYAGSDATLKDNSFSRFNLRLNSDIVLAKNLTTRFDASYSDVTRNLRDDAVKGNVTDGIISAPGFLSLIKSPFLSPYAFDSNGNMSGYLAEADDYLSDVVTSKNYVTSLANPVALLQQGEGDNKNYFGNRTITLAVTPTWNVNKYLTLSDHFAFQIINTDENYYLPTNGVPNYEVEGIGTVENCASALASRQTTIQNDLSASYKRRFNAHLLDVKGGFRYLNESYNLNTQIGYNTGNDKTPNMSSSLSYKQTDGVENHDVDLNYYLTANYNYAERYYLSAGVSMDGSSKFGVDAKDGVKIGNYAFGFFPSVQGAWVITNEKWFRPNSIINYLKLNAGFDMLGNDDLSSIASRTYFVSGKMFNVLTGKTIGNIGNTSLQWETTKRITAGLQFSFFNNRISGSVNYFNSNTTNLLALSRLSYLSGIKTNWTNDGRVVNQGFDANLNIKVLSLRDWKWSVAGSVGHYKNEIKALPNSANAVTTELYNATIISKVGAAVGSFYGYKTDGVFASADDAEKSGLYLQTETGAKKYFQAGDMKFVDVNGDKCIDEKDQQIIGDPNPSFYGNFSTQLSWKNLSLDVQFNYSVGGDIYNYQRSILESGSYFYNQTTAMLGRWTHEGQVTDIPRASFLDDMGNSRFSDRWIEDGSYLKLKNITLSYRLPLNNAYIQGITIWGAANNLFTFTKYLGSDPESSQSNSVIGMGIDRGMLGVGRSFSLGVKINL